MTITIARFLALLAFVAFVVAAIVCFLSTEVPTRTVLGVIAAGLALLALAPVAA